MIRPKAGSAEADPAFWIGARCKSVRVSHYMSGAVEHVYAVVGAGRKIARVVDSGRRPGAPPYPLQAHVLKLAKNARTKGATAAMREVLPHVARVEAEVAALLPAADAKALEVARRRDARAAAEMNEHRRKKLLSDLRAGASLVEEHEVVTAWREGVVEGVHRL